VKLSEGVLGITLNRPESLNAVNTRLLEDLVRLVDAAGRDPAVRVIVLRGAGRAFCAGSDINDLAAIEAANAAVTAIVTVPRPVVALVQGAAAGVGMSFALASDVAVLASSAYLMMAFTKIGLMPDGGASLLVSASVGRARALRMALLADRVDAATAESWGLVSQVVPDDELDRVGAELAARLACGPAQALSLTKRALNLVGLSGLEEALAREVEGQAALEQTADHAEGLAAFLQKRPPRYDGAPVGSTP
jgi:enoyl-CoA hydratase